MAELDDDDDADDADMAMRLGFKATIVNYAHGTGQLCSVGAVKIPFTKFPKRAQRILFASSVSFLPLFECAAPTVVMPLEKASTFTMRASCRMMLIVVVVHPELLLEKGFVSSFSSVHLSKTKSHRITWRLFGRGKGGGDEKKEKKPNKSNLPEKICVVCNRPFTWRKKWERCWDEVTCCSNSCNAQRRSSSSGEK
jgi:hypothetical protein